MNDRHTPHATAGEACPELDDLVDATRLLGPDPRATMAHFLACDACGDRLDALSAIRALLYDEAGAASSSGALAEWANEAAEALSDASTARLVSPVPPDGAATADGLGSRAARVALSVVTGACGAATGFGAIMLLAGGLDVSLAATLAGALTSGLVAGFAGPRGRFAGTLAVLRRA